MNRLLNFFAGHPTAANLVMALMILLGVMSIPEMKRETFPSFTVGKAKISIIYPGASSEEVEQGICLVLQDAIDGISNVDETTCEAKEGSAVARRQRKLLRSD